jgi:uncharacterized RDD family membrane protein YckC/tRNA A-37 threonylcarbamoyl transferase component Bud32
VAEGDDSFLSPGTRLAHYEILQPVGEGAMGTVYEAHDSSLERTVAIKVLKSELAEDQHTVERFEREARAAARVTHPNLTHIYFVGPDGDRHYFAMEFVPGSTLDEYVDELGAMDVNDAVDVLVQIAKGLRAAHEAGVVHRDVKPANLKLPPDGVVKLTDFGLSKTLTGDMDVTGEGRILGTPRYMSPEQCRGEKVDWRTDVYSLGLVGFFLLTGRHAFDADTIGKLLDEQMNRPLPQLRELRPEVPPKLEKLLRKCCEKDREHRPVSMGRIIARLEDSRPQALDPATIAARGSAFVIDIAVWLAFVGISVGTVLLLTGIQEGEKTPSLFVALLLSTVFFILSNLGMEAWKGTTLGKRAFRLRVVRIDGTPPFFPALVARFLIRLPIVVMFVIPERFQVTHAMINWLQFLSILAGVVCYFALRRRTLSDLVTRTRVIYVGSPVPRERA